MPNDASQTRTSIRRAPAQQGASVRSGLRRFFPITTENRRGNESEQWRIDLISAAREALLAVQDLIHARRVDVFGSAGDIRTWDGHPGDLGVAEDFVVDELLHRRFGSRAATIYHGEERPAGLVNWMPGTVIVESDPVDGSHQVRDLGAGSAIALSAWKIDRHGRLRHLAGVILRIDGTMVSWTVPDARVIVRVPFYDGERRYELRGGDIRLGNPKVVACVGAIGPQLSKIAELDQVICAERRLAVYNQAGTPTTVSLLLDDLSAVFEPQHAKVWDALGLVPVQLTGGAIFDMDGRPRNVIADMEAQTGLSPAKRRIEPYIAVSHPDALQTVLDITKRERGPANLARS